MLVKSIEHHSDDQKKQELEKDQQTTEDQSHLAASFTAAGKIALDHHLVGAVSRKGQEGASQKSGPESIGHTQIEGEIHKLELLQGCCQAHHFRPSVGDARQDDEEGQDGPGEVEQELDDIIPDHRPHSSVERICDGDSSNDDHTPGV